MAGRIDWGDRIGRRLKLRDLHVYFTVVQCGSMAKAAAELGVAQPTVSEIIADLEHTFGVRLLDRGARGVEPTMYGSALLKRGVAAFDELKQSIQEIGSLADPASGEVKLRCHESVSAILLTQVMQRFSATYPRVVVHVESVANATAALPALPNRECDLVIGRLHLPIADDRLNVETLFDDPLIVAAGANNPLAGRRRADLADLLNEPWILQEPHTWNYRGLREACQARGLSMPKACLVTLSMPLIAEFLANGYLTAYPRSMTFDKSVRALPLILPVRPWSFSVITLKHRTLSPAVERFLECVRAVAKSAASWPQAPRQRSTKNAA
jgi:DNA-binding transcriptional LysR family regulator